MEGETVGYGIKRGSEDGGRRGVLLARPLSHRIEMGDPVGAGADGQENTSVTTRRKVLSREIRSLPAPTYT